jgi:Tol biopolymer transport system component
MRFSRLDVLVWSISALLVAGTAAVLMRGDNVGIRIISVAPAHGSKAAGSAPIEIQFAESMDKVSLESHFEIQPSVEGSFIWRNNTAYFEPKIAWEPNGVYRVTLHAGVMDQLDHQLANDYSWTFSIRQPGIVFIRGNELWAKNDLVSDSFQLTHSAASVFDFTVSVDGEQVVYSVINEETGIDLWVVDRDGSNEKVLLDCGADRCSAPDWSIIGQIAYSRASAPLTPAEPYSAPRIWLLDPKTLETVRLHADTQKIGFGPVWSPDGQKIAYYDGIQSRIVIIDISSGEEISLPSLAGDVGSWSSDGKQLIYHDLVISDTQSSTLVFRADLETLDILPYFDPLPSNATFSYPVSSPDGKWIAFKTSFNEAGFGDQLWVFPVNENHATVASEAPEFLITNAAWNPWSDSLVFSKVQLGVGNPIPEIWIWNMKTASLLKLETDGNAPAWLP